MSKRGALGGNASGDVFFDRIRSAHPPPITITLPTLHTHRLIWIPNAGPKRVQKL